MASRDENSLHGLKLNIDFMKGENLLSPLFSMYKIEINRNEIYFEDESYCDYNFDRNIIFKGHGNTLFIGSNSRIHANTKITFNGNNALAFLAGNNKSVNINLHLHQNNLFYLGHNNTFNGTLTVIAAESKNIFIGNHCLFSFGIFIRTSDAHLIYDLEGEERINFSKDVIIGNHVWIAQQALILKGTIIKNGCIIGARSVLCKETEQSSIYAGSPARLIKSNIFWKKDSNHNFTDTDTAKYIKARKFQLGDEFNIPKILQQNTNKLISSYEKCVY